MVGRKLPLLTAEYSDEWMDALYTANKDTDGLLVSLRYCVVPVETEATCEGKQERAPLSVTTQ